MIHPSTRIDRTTQNLARQSLLGLVIWLAATSSPLAADTLFVTWGQEIIEYDTATAEELTRFDLPAVPGGSRSVRGIAYTEGRLFLAWLDREAGLVHITELDPVTGDVVDDDSFGPEALFWYGIAAHEGLVYVTRSEETPTSVNHTIDVFDPTTDQIVGSLSVHPPFPVSGSYFLDLAILPNGREAIGAFGGGSIGMQNPYVLAPIDLETGASETYFAASNYGGDRVSITRLGPRVARIDNDPNLRAVRIYASNGQLVGVLDLPVVPSFITIGQETDGRVDIPTLSPLALGFLVGLLALGGLGVLHNRRSPTGAAR